MGGGSQGGGGSQVGGASMALSQTGSAAVASLLISKGLPINPQIFQLSSDIVLQNYG